MGVPCISVDGGVQGRVRAAAIPVQRSGRTERSAPDTTLQDMGFADINIQTYGPNASAALNGGAASAAPPPPPAVASKGEPSPGSKQRPPASGAHASRQVALLLAPGVRRPDALTVRLHAQQLQGRVA